MTLFEFLQKGNSFSFSVLERKENYIYAKLTSGKSNLNLIISRFLPNSIEKRHNIFDKIIKFVKSKKNQAELRRIDKQLEKFEANKKNIYSSFIFDAFDVYYQNGKDALFDYIEKSDYLIQPKIK